MSAVRSRCMGGKFCNHAPGTCTADPVYQKEMHDNGAGLRPGSIIIGGIMQDFMREQAQEMRLGLERNLRFLNLLRMNGYRVDVFINYEGRPAFEVPSGWVECLGFMVGFLPEGTK